MAVNIAGVKFVRDALDVPIARAHEMYMNNPEIAAVADYAAVEIDRLLSELISLRMQANQTKEKEDGEENV